MCVEESQGRGNKRKEKPKDRNKKKPSGKEENNVIAAAWL